MTDKKTTKEAPQGKYFYAIGRRKTSSARIKIFPDGKGEMTVNGKNYKDFYPLKNYQRNLENPFETVGLGEKFDVEIKIVGGGLNSGSEACRLGIARALIKYNPELKPALRAVGFTTRDPRAKERKKPGLKRARRAPQWSKR